MRHFLLYQQLDKRVFGRWARRKGLESDAGRLMRRGRMNSLCFLHETTGKIPTHEAALTAFYSGVRDCVCGFAAAVADAEVCARAALARALLGHRCLCQGTTSVVPHSRI
jgi:hypothetical protein